ncbi:MAG: hypothetical protein GX539_09810 [Candidatus Cloacimonetes bacterium]|nr:hypothetical protein [Candidatus Cloacimonadota bacterium]
MPVALTIDVVGSRRIADRAAAQRHLDAAIARVTEDVPGVVTPLHPIVGDEMQGVYADLDSALSATLLFQLALPDTVECRFGAGIGEVGVVPSAAGGISDGPGWWAAREAIDAVERLARRDAPSARTRVAASESAPSDARAGVALANAYLLSRDELGAAMSERTRRLTYGRCLGLTQSALADAEGITQSAVSQALASSGASAVVEGFRLLQS